MDLMRNERKCWNELTDREKIERMREQVKFLESRLSRANERINKLEEHNHDVNGKLILPYRYHEFGQEKCDCEPGKEYF